LCCCSPAATIYKNTSTLSYRVKLVTGTPSAADVAKFGDGSFDGTVGVGWGAERVSHMRA
jgi:hypothetical protein